MFPTVPRLPVLLLGLMFAASMCAQPSSPDAKQGHSIGQKRKIRGLPNFGEVSPTLFRGAQPSPEGFHALAKMGVNIVVDLRGDRTDSEGKIVQQLGMQYVPMPWRCPFPNDNVLAKFLKLVQDNPHKKTFVHCRLGDDRTGMMVAAYRMEEQGWTADEAMGEMQQFGFSTIHHVICPGLASYEHAFPEHLRKNSEFQTLYDPVQNARP